MNDELTSYSRTGGVDMFEPAAATVFKLQA
jgi:hypothetical protein